MISNKIRVREYLTKAGRNPYREWMEQLDVAVRARIQARIFRVERGVSVSSWRVEVLIGILV